MTTIPKFMMLPRPRCSFSEDEVALDGVTHIIARTA